VNEQHTILRTGGYVRADVLLEWAGELSRGEQRFRPCCPRDDCASEDLSEVGEERDKNDQGEQDDVPF